MNKQNYVTISYINENIRTVLTENIGFVKLQGEISSITFHKTGHIYLTLKDKKSQLDAVIFSNIIKPEFLNLKVGDFVYALGNITSYVKSGKISYQIFYISTQGQGEIQENFNELLKKMDKEGFFLPQKKLTYSPFFSKIAILTSLTGAALTDFLSLIHGKLLNNTEIFIIPCLMQGEKTTLSIIEGLNTARTIANLDLVLITRGGGAYEDLYGFNQKELALFVSAYNIPVMSAIGHEQDITLLDHVSHTRFATPSSAANQLFSFKPKVLLQLEHFKEKLNYSFKQNISNMESYINSLQELLLIYLQNQIQHKEIYLEFLKKHLEYARINTKNKENNQDIQVLEHNGKIFIHTRPIRIKDTLLLKTSQGKFIVEVIQKKE